MTARLMNLEQMLERHGDRYFLHHWSWAPKTAVTAKQAARLLKLHMDGVLKGVAEEGGPVEDVKRMVFMAQRYIADLWELSPADFEKLRRLDDEELMTHIPMDFSGTPPWLKFELEKEGGNVRFKDE